MLMFDDLNHVPSARGWILIWSCLLSFHCPIDVSTPLLCIFKLIYLSLVCVCACACVLYTHPLLMCAEGHFFPWPTISCHPLPNEVLMKGVNALAPARWPSVFGFDVVFSWAVTKHHRNKEFFRLQSWNSHILHSSLFNFFPQLDIG